jgi:protein transport protein SEC20
LDVLLIELEGLRAQSEANYLSLKKASAFSRHAIENQDQSELFRRSSNSDEEESVRKRRLDKETLSKKASGLTEDLLSISQLMSSQVAVSEQSLNSLISSSAVVTETQEEFKMMGSLLGQSRKLLAKFGRREVTDRALIMFALAFYFASCTYVVLKRLF